MTNDDEIQAYIMSNKSKGTVYNTNSGCRLLALFKDENFPADTSRNFWDLPPVELDLLMSRYFMKAEKLEKTKLKDGDKLYQPDALTSHRNAWQRCLDKRIRHSRGQEQCLAVEGKN